MAAGLVAVTRLGHPFGDEIASSHIGGVAGLIFGAPQIEAAPMVSW